MYKFTLKSIEENVVFTGTGEKPHLAFDSLCNNIYQYTGVHPKDHEIAYSELLEYALMAVGNPNQLMQKRDFSTPEDNYDILFEYDKT